MIGLQEEKDLFFEEEEELELISEWVKTSETGSKSEFTFLPSTNFTVKTVSLLAYCQVPI